MRIVFILLFISGVTYRGIAQQFDISKLQKPGSEINSESHESQPMLTPKGDTLYFIRSGYEENTGGRYSGHDIWYSVKNNGSWSVAQNTLENLNSAENNAVVGINTTGDHIYLINSYSPPMRRNRGVVYAKKDKGIWSTPREIDLSIDLKGSFYGFYMHPDEEVLIISMNSDGSLGQEDLYVSIKKEGVWSKPSHLGDIINSKGYEIAPFLSAGKDSLFFASNGHEGLGDADIFVSTRLSDDWQQWSAPVNLGEPVNSPAFDAYYFQRGKDIFFSSSREGNSDIYIITTKEEKEEVAGANVEEKQEEFVEEDSEEKADVTYNDYAKNEKDDAIIELLSKKYLIYFEFDEYQLDAADKTALNDLVSTLKQSTGLKIKVLLTGHADSKGPESYNTSLSLQRAEQVAAFLKSSGFDFSDIDTAGKGEQDPSAANDSPEGRAQNRRVEITLEEIK